MTRSNRFALHVEFGDCHPAQIAYFPNFFRRADAASRRLACDGIFESCLLVRTSSPQRLLRQPGAEKEV